MLMSPARGEQMAAVRLSMLHGSRERAEDMPRSCEGCGHCCGRVIPTDEVDNVRVMRYATRHRLEPTDHNVDADGAQMCGWLDMSTGKCRIYQARPKICRCWGSPHDGPLVGTRPGQPCGLRTDMLDVWQQHGPLGDYDTWKSEWRPYGFENDHERLKELCNGGS